MWALVRQVLYTVYGNCSSVVLLQIYHLGLMGNPLVKGNPLTRRFFGIVRSVILKGVIAVRRVRRCVDAVRGVVVGVVSVSEY